MFTGRDGGLTYAAGLAARDILWKNSLKPWTMNLRLNCRTSAVIGFSPFGLPSVAAPKVAQAFHQSLRRNTRKHPQAATSHKEGQGDLRGKQHRSNWCEASATCKDEHLHRHEDSPICLNPMHGSDYACLPSSFSWPYQIVIIVDGQIQKEKMG
jgi:hypothetical protein